VPVVGTGIHVRARGELGPPGQTESFLDGGRWAPQSNSECNDCEIFVRVCGTVSAPGRNLSAYSGTGVGLVSVSVSRGYSCSKNLLLPKANTLSALQASFTLGAPCLSSPP